ncbi:unnamed protein product [Lepeophtheirus salmonis]|uniref:(salmon louse) hypothetical protein n=1 Tax=Lepeophtheirus salmonis TaxID=72036 RepID=A0A7R8CGH8_LEPSM|nr:unnamed protein product [Lepeophtheirus salmonis]CAF2758807.1 unnamed protein product [Lepeophtheirus salmonis]
MESQNDLLKMRNELARESKTWCLHVFKYSHLLNISSSMGESVFLEDYNAQLEGFLYDIEQLVLDDAEVSVKEQGESPTVCGLHNLNISKVTTFQKVKKTVERYGQELQDLNNELGTLKELHNENLKKMEIQLERYSQLLASNTVLSSKVDELQIIINELEETNLTQKKIVFEQANTIEGMTQDVKVLKHEKELYLNESNNISKDQKYFEISNNKFEKGGEIAQNYYFINGRREANPL